VLGLLLAFAQCVSTDFATQIGQNYGLLRTKKEKLLVIAAFFEIFLLLFWQKGLNLQKKYGNICV
jgi:hypothetical protein